MNKIYLFILVFAAFSINTKAQSCNETWVDYGNDVINMYMSGISGQDKKSSEENYTYTMAMPTNSSMPVAFKFSKNNGRSTSGSPYVEFEFDGKLENKKIEENVYVYFEATIYVCADEDASTKIDLADIPRKQRKVAFAINGDGVKSRQKSVYLKNFKPGWQTVSGKITIEKGHASNLNEYTKLKITFGKPVEGHSNGKKYYASKESPTSDTDFLAENVDFYIASVKSDIKIN